MKKFFKLYNNTQQKTKVTLKIENQSYFVDREALQLLLLENFEQYKNCSNYVGLIQSELKDLEKKKIEERNILITNQDLVY